MLVMWGLTPVHGALFDLRPINQTSNILGTSTTTLLAFSEQEKLIQPRLAYKPYGVSWLGQHTPSKDFALAGVYLNSTASNVIDLSRFNGNSTLISFSTDRYDTDLDCDILSTNDLAAQPMAPLNYTAIYGTRQSLISATSVAQASYDHYHSGIQVDKKDPTAAFFPNSGHNITISWVPMTPMWENQTQEFRSMEAEGCLDLTTNLVESNNFTYRPARITCTARYYRQKVRGEVDSTTNTVLSTTPEGPRLELSRHEFDIASYERTLFEAYYFVDAFDQACPYGSYVPGNQDRYTFPTKNLYTASPGTCPTYGNKEVVHDSSFRYLSPNTLLTGLAIAAVDEPLSSLLDATKLWQAYENAHRLLFAATVPALLQNSASPASGDSATRILRQTTAIVIVQTFAVAAELILVTAIFVSIALSWTIRNRANSMTRDLSTIQRLSAIFDNQGTFLSDLSNNCSSSNDQIARTLNDKKYRLTLDDTGSRLESLESPVKDSGEKIDIKSAPDTERSIHDRRPEFLTPWAFRGPTGLTFIAVLIGLAATLLALYRKAIMCNGAYFTDACNH
jgi:hypothetical protein